MSLYIIRTFVTIIPETVILNGESHDIATNEITYSVIRIFIRVPDELIYKISTRSLQSCFRYSVNNTLNDIPRKQKITLYEFISTISKHVCYGNLGVIIDNPCIQVVNQWQGSKDTIEPSLPMYDVIVFPRN